MIAMTTRSSTSVNARMGHPLPCWIVTQGEGPG
jgi:hypothetical protein